MCVIDEGFTRCPQCRGAGVVPVGEVRHTANYALEKYYRRKAAGAKTTLRKIAAETGYSYDYLRVAKRRYDAAGKWGSKKAKP